MDNRTHGVHSWPMRSGCIELIYSSALHSIDSVIYCTRQMVEIGYHVQRTEGDKGSPRSGREGGNAKPVEFLFINLVSIFTMYRWATQLGSQGKRKEKKHCSPHSTG